MTRYPVYGILRVAMQSTEILAARILALETRCAAIEARLAAAESGAVEGPPMTLDVLDDQPGDYVGAGDDCALAAVHEEYYEWPDWADTLARHLARRGRITPLGVAEAVWTKRDGDCGVTCAMLAEGIQAECRELAEHGILEDDGGGADYDEAYNLLDIGWACEDRIRHMGDVARDAREAHRQNVKRWLHTRMVKDAGAAKANRYHREALTNGAPPRPTAPKPAHIPARWQQELAESAARNTE